MILKIKDIDKIELEAAQEDKEPLMCIEIRSRTVYVMTEETFEYIRGLVEDLM